MNHTFKLSSNNNKIKNRKVKTDYSLIIVIACVVFAIICIIISIVLSASSNRVEEETNTYIDNSNLPNIEKKDESKEYVYTIEKIENKTQEETFDEVPYINIDSPEIEKINKEIKDKYLLVAKKEEYGYLYKYSEGNSIISLLTEYIYSPVPNSDTVSFYKSYNIDMKTGKLLTASEILQRYNITVDELKMFVAAKFKEYYDDLVEKGYYKDKDCDYSCFLKNRGISTDYLKGVSIYIDKGKLTLYKYFYKDSEYEEGKYFEDISYQIVVKK